MYRHKTPRQRLGLWAAYPYKSVAIDGDKRLPPKGWYMGHTVPAEPSTTTTKDGVLMVHYGEGIGGDVEGSRPGFRFKGYADEIRSVDHTGWYGNSHQDGFDFFRGVVYQLPARSGELQYIAGYEWGESGKEFYSGGGTLYTDEIFDNSDDAARRADEHAENAANDCMECREKEDA